MSEDFTTLTEDEIDERELKLGRALSVQHKIFADRLVQGASQTKAATDAGYSEKDAKRTATRIAKRKDVSTYVHLLREKQRRVAGIDREWVIRKHLHIAKKAELDSDWVAVRQCLAEVAKLLDFYPAQKTVGKLEHTGSIEHTGSVGINTNYMSNEVLQEIFELKRKEAAHETGSSKVH